MSECVCVQGVGVSIKVAALISIDGIGGVGVMLIWVIAYVNAQLGSLHCQNTSAGVCACHPALAPTRQADGSAKHTPILPVPGRDKLPQLQTASISRSVTVSAPTRTRVWITHRHVAPPDTHGQKRAPRAVFVVVTAGVEKWSWRTALPLMGLH